MPSIVENIIQTGIITPDSKIGRIRHFDTGEVVTVIPARG